MRIGWNKVDPQSNMISVPIPLMSLEDNLYTDLLTGRIPGEHEGRNEGDTCKSWRMPKIPGKYQKLEERHEQIPPADTLWSLTSDLQTMRQSISVV